MSRRLKLPPAPPLAPHQRRLLNISRGMVGFLFLGGVGGIMAGAIGVQGYGNEVEWAKGTVEERKVRNVQHRCNDRTEDLIQVRRLAQRLL
jgi:hypothetical protein